MCLNGRSEIHRKGMTLLEVIVVIAVLAILMALLLPAVQSVRTSARRTQCISNLKQFGVAMHAFHDQHSMFPPGNARYKSLHVSILPFIDQKALSDSLPTPYTGFQLDALARTSIPLFNCPADPGATAVHPTVGANPLYTTNYFGNSGTGFQVHGHNGMFHSIALGRVTSADVTDGLSNTAAISETLVSDGSQNLRRVIFSTPFPLLQPSELDQFASLCRSTAVSGVSSTGSKGRPWSWGDPGTTLYNHVLYPNDASCFNSSKVQEGAYSVGSEHLGGVNVLMGDGHVRFVNNQINLDIWRAMGSRQGGEVLAGQNQ